MTKPTPYRLLKQLVLLAALVASPTWALESDKKQPTTIDADQMTYSEQKNVNVFKGNVLLTRGSLVVRGDVLTLTQFPDGSQFAVVEGKPATFKQQRDSKTPEVLLIKGTGTRIEVDSAKSIVTLLGEASLRKTSNDVLTEEITGRKIVYEQNTEFLTVDGADRAPGAKGNAPRVQAVIRPRLDGK